VARALIDLPSIIGVGDALFAGVHSQTFQYVGDDHA
jgi:hypothetical protein